MADHALLGLFGLDMLYRRVRRAARLQWLWHLRSVVEGGLGAIRLEHRATDALTPTASVSGEGAVSLADNPWSGESGFTPECGFTFYIIAIDDGNGGVANRTAPCFVVNNPLSRNRLVTTYWSAFAQDEIGLTDLNVEVPAGSFICVLGRNGAGK